jgi:hypothetical protein
VPKQKRKLQLKPTNNPTQRGRTYGQAISGKSENKQPFEILPARYGEFKGKILL